MRKPIELFTEKELKEINAVTNFPTNNLKSTLTSAGIHFEYMQHILVGNLPPLTKIKFVNYCRSQVSYPSLPFTQQDIVEKAMNWKAFPLDLSHQDASEICFEGAFLDNANFERANLNEADFSKASSLINVNFQYAQLKDANLSNLKKEKIQGMQLMHADLSRANLENTDLSGFDLTGVKLKGANIVGVNLSNATLMDANLQELDLRGRDFSGMDLRNTNLRGADLRGANLSGANLNGADLTGAILDGANLINAKIATANFTNTSMQGMRYFPVIETLDHDQVLLRLEKIVDEVRNNKDRNKVRDVVIDNIFLDADKIQSDEDEHKDKENKDFFYKRVMTSNLFNLNETSIASKAVNTVSSMFQISENRYHLVMPTSAQKRFIEKIESLNLPVEEKQQEVRHA